MSGGVKIIEAFEIFNTLYKKPFRYDSDGQMVWDVRDFLVLDVRGWGRIQHIVEILSHDNKNNNALKGMSPENIQDAVGEWIVDRLNGNKSLEKRSKKIELLEKYSKWLEKNSYMDTDWWQEEPYAIDEFLKNDK